MYPRAGVSLSTASCTAPKAAVVVRAPAQTPKASAGWNLKTYLASSKPIISVQALGLGEKLSSLPNQLSGGQQQRVAIARALAAKPAIILADEPTGNLDSKTSQDVLGLIKVTSQRYSQTTVMITHNEEIAQMADRIVRIEDGRIVGNAGLRG